MSPVTRRALMPHDPLITTILHALGVETPMLVKAVITIEANSVVYIETTHLATAMHADGAIECLRQSTRKFTLMEDKEEQPNAGTA